MIVRPSSSIPLLFCIFLWKAGCVVAESNYTDFDTFPTCHTPTNGSQYIPPDGACAVDNSALPITAAYDIAWKYAPYLWHHSLEQYHMTTPELHVGNGSEGDILLMTDTERIPVIPLTVESLYETARNLEWSFKATEFYIHRNTTDKSWKNGSPFNDNGTTTAPVYYNVYEYDDNTWVYNYYMYYSWNGCSNQWMITLFGSVVGSYMYYLCELGTHEGDWESLSVMVCKNTDGETMPLAVKYNQHEWNEFLDCSQNECELNGTHPLGGIALNSHATYPQLSDNIVYVNIKIPFLYNIRGVYLTDRTQKDDSKRFEPHPGNVLRIPDNEELNNGTDDLAWAAYLGHWGNVTLDQEAEFIAPTCISDNQTEIIACPTDDGFFNIMLELFGLRGSPGDPFFYGIAKAFVGPGKGPTGPYRKDFWGHWVPHALAPVNKNNQTFSSKDADNSNQTGPCPDPSTWEDYSYNSDGEVINYNAFGVVLIGSIILAILLALLTIVVMKGGCCRPLRGAFKQKNEGKSKFQRFIAACSRFSPLWSIFFLFCTIGAFCMITFAMQDLIEGSLTRYFPDVDWHVIIALVNTVGGLIIILTGIVTCTNCSIYMYFYYESTGRSPPSYVRWFLSSENGNQYLVSFGVGITLICLFVSLALFLLCFALGGIYWGIAEVCVATLGSLGNDICLDFNILGLKEISCGAEFEDLCRSFGRGATNTMVWGAALLVLCLIFQEIASVSLYWHYFYVFSAYLRLDERQEESERSHEPSLGDMDEARSGNLGNRLGAETAGGTNNNVPEGTEDALHSVHEISTVKKNKATDGEPSRFDSVDMQSSSPKDQPVVI